MHGLEIRDSEMDVNTVIDVKKELLALSDDDNAEFVRKLVPGDRVIIGARLPAMRDLAKRVAKDDWRSYIESWQPECMEDYMLRGLVIAYARMDVDEKLDEYRKFIPLIDNWSVCDSFCNTWKPKKNEREKVWDFIVPYLRTDDEFQMRFSAVMMLALFITDDHIDDVISLLNSADNDGYYFRMAKAWTLSVCFVKYPDITMPYLEKGTLDDETMKMTVRKIIDSYRVSDEMKTKVRGLVSRN